MKLKALVTGGTGFVGASLLATMRGHGIEVVGTTRSLGNLDQGLVGGLDLSNSAGWSVALDGKDIVIHTAARVHVMQESASDALSRYRAINVDATVALASRAVERGVRRFVYVSSVKVNGESTPLGQPFRADSIPAPQDPYGRSKLEAEHALLEIGRRTGLEIVIVRPPLVYGRGVKANFQALVRLVKSGVPLPLGNTGNKRSMVNLANLTDLLLLCCTSAKASGKVLMVSDGQDVSTTELVTLLKKILGTRSTLFPVPKEPLRAIFKILRRTSSFDRLFGNLQVDIDETQTSIGWTPKYGILEGLADVVSGMKARAE